METMARPHSDSQTVDDLILGLPRAEQVIVKRLRSLILECLPKATEKSYYDGVPLYTRNRMICYIWPPSVSVCSNPKGKEKNKAVGLAFCQGNRMANEDGALLAEGRKQVYCMYFRSIDEINERQLRALFFEAGMIDDGFRKSR